MAVTHFHLWLYPDNGTAYPTALFRRAKKYPYKQAAYRAAKRMGYSVKHDAVVMGCDCE